MLKVKDSLYYKILSKKHPKFVQVVDKMNKEDIYFF